MHISIHCQSLLLLVFSLFQVRFFLTVDDSVFNYFSFSLMSFEFFLVHVGLKLKGKEIGEVAEALPVAISGLV